MKTELHRQEFKLLIFVHAVIFVPSSLIMYCITFTREHTLNGQCSYSILVQLKQEEGWVVCRVFKKKIASMRIKMSENESPCWYDDQVSFMPELDSPGHNSSSMNMNMVPYHHLPNYPCKKELDHLPFQVPHEHFFQLPLLGSPKLVQSSSATAVSSSNSMAPHAYSIDINHTCTFQSSDQDQNFQGVVYGNSSNDDHQRAVDQLTDWRALDKFVASQLSQDDASKGNSYS